MLGATALALFGMCAFLLRVAEPHLTLLYRELELADSSAIVDRRKALGVTFRLQGDGRAILVPADRARRLHMTPAAEGLGTAPAGTKSSISRARLATSTSSPT